MNAPDTTPPAKMETPPAAFDHDRPARTAIDPPELETDCPVLKTIFPADPRTSVPLIDPDATTKLPDNTEVTATEAVANDKLPLEERPDEPDRITTWPPELS